MRGFLLLSGSILGLGSRSKNWSTFSLSSGKSSVGQYFGVWVSVLTFSLSSGKNAVISGADVCVAASLVPSSSDRKEANLLSTRLYISIASFASSIGSVVFINLFFL